MAKTTVTGFELGLTSGGRFPLAYGACVMTNQERLNEQYRQSQEEKSPMALPTYDSREMKCSCGWLGRLAGRTVCPNCSAPAATLREWKW